MPDKKEIAAKPFSMEFVIGLTIRNMVRAVDTSVSKTLDRIAEFEGDQSKSTEVFGTIAHLHDIKKQVLELQSEYDRIIKSNTNQNKE